MRPQLQAHSGGEGGPYGDCHRTCIAMILDMDRDEVPHFMAEVPPNAPVDDPACVAAEEAERDWLSALGLTPVYVPYDGSASLDHILAILSRTARDAAVILGCTSSNGSNHSVVVYQGRIYNPNMGTVVGPMADGMWWVTVYARATHPIPEPKDRPDQVTTEHLPTDPADPNVVTEQED